MSDTANKGLDAGRLPRPPTNGGSTLALDANKTKETVRGISYCSDRGQELAEQVFAC